MRNSYGNTSRRFASNTTHVTALDGFSLRTTFPLPGTAGAAAVHGAHLSRAHAADDPSDSASVRSAITSDTSTDNIARECISSETTSRALSSERSWSSVLTFAQLAAEGSCLIPSI